MSSELANFLHQIAYRKENQNIIVVEHSYSKARNTSSENSYAKPTKFLFALPPVDEKEPDSDIEIDCTTIEEPPTVPYTIDYVKALMIEIETLVDNFRPIDSSNDDEDWEEKIDTFGWSQLQLELFKRICAILNDDNLARLALETKWNEGLATRLAINRTVSRMRKMYSSVSWNMQLCQWLHGLLMQHLTRSYLVSYLEALRTLRTKVPGLVEKMISGTIMASRRNTNLDNSNVIFKPPWDPLGECFNGKKPCKLPGEPIIIVIPPVPCSDFFGSARYKRWHEYLSALGSLHVVSMKLDQENKNTSLTNVLDKFLACAHLAVSESKVDNPRRPIILMGFGCGASLAFQISLLESISAIVSISFPVRTVDGKRGDPSDTMMDIRCPVFFIIGQVSSTALQKEVEEIRNKLHVETGLLVVAKADDHLIVPTSQLCELGATQCMVDFCVLDETANFLGSVLLQPKPHLRSMPNQATSPSISPNPDIQEVKKVPKRKTVSVSCGTAPTAVKRYKSRKVKTKLGPQKTITAEAAAIAASALAVSCSGSTPVSNAVSHITTTSSLTHSAPGSPAAESVSLGKGLQTQNSSGITVNIGSLGSLAPIGPIKLGQTTIPSSTTTVNNENVLKKSTVVSQACSGTSLTIQGNVISSANGRGRATVPTKMAIQLQGKPVSTSRGRSEHNAAASALSNILQSPSTRIVIPASTGNSSVPLYTQVRVFGNDEPVHVLNPAHPAAARFRTGRILDLSKLSYCGSSGQPNKNTSSPPVKTNAALSEPNQRPVLVPVSSPVILPIRGKANNTNNNTGQRSFAVIPKLSMPVKVGYSPIQNTSNTIAKANLNNIQMNNNIIDKKDIDQTNKIMDNKNLTDSLLDKIMDIPIIFAKDNDDTLLFDKGETTLLPEKPTVVPITPVGHGDASTKTVKIGDTISFPLDDMECDKPETVTDKIPLARKLRNVYIISKNSKEKVALGAKRIVTKTPRIVRPGDKMQGASPNRNLKYTKIILTNRNAPIKVTDLKGTVNQKMIKGPGGSLKNSNATKLTGTASTKKIDSSNSVIAELPNQKLVGPLNSTISRPLSPVVICSNNTKQGLQPNSKTEGAAIPKDIGPNSPTCNGLDVGRFGSPNSPKYSDSSSPISTASNSQATSESVESTNNNSKYVGSSSPKHIVESSSILLISTSPTGQPSEKLVEPHSPKSTKPASPNFARSESPQQISQSDSNSASPANIDHPSSIVVISTSPQGSRSASPQFSKSANSQLTGPSSPQMNTHRACSPTVANSNTSQVKMTKPDPSQNTASSSSEFPIQFCPVKITNAIQSNSKQQASHSPNNIDTNSGTINRKSGK